LRPGDVLLVRAEDKITSALLPGFWAHAAMYIGTPESLAQSGLLDHPKVARLKHIFDRMSSPNGVVVEAVPRGCRIHALEYCLQADHVAVLRPNIDEAQIKQTLIEAISHVGKPYDFEFDFNVTSRIVCTELIYRSLHGRGTVSFELTKRLGRYTLTADDLVEQQLAAHDACASSAPFSVVELLISDGAAEAQQVGEPERLTRLGDILRDRRQAMRAVPSTEVAS
jgi:hypothetical protein